MGPGISPDAGPFLHDTTGRADETEQDQLRFADAFPDARPRDLRPALPLPNSADLEPLLNPTSEQWLPADAERIYHVPAWGGRYFFVNERGHVGVRKRPESALAADVHAVLVRLREEGVQFPALIRFQDILHDRVVELNESFRGAIRNNGYQNGFRGVYPIKVNQLREVVEEILDAGEAYGFGLECGSKSELVATLPFLEQYDVELLCNGCKDDEMMALMVAGQMLGRRVYPIVERIEEYAMFRKAVRSGGKQVDENDAMGAFGVRVRLSTSGAGLWSESGGANSKFGISLTELIGLVDELERTGLSNRFHLLHFHLGSQIADVSNIGQAAREAARVYAWLYRRGVHVRAIDVGGGLGVNYEAGNPDAIGHINYDLDEYTSTIVRALRDVMDQEGVPHPRIISESGRAITAHHSVLVVEAIGVRGKDRLNVAAPASESPLLTRLQGIYDRITTSLDDADIEKAHEDAARVRTEIIDGFREGRVGVEDKALAERLFWTISRHNCLAARDAGLSADARVRADLEPQLVDHYLCDFSVFRSMVDYWAIGQRFPIMPLHRLDERPTRRGMLDDLTCDSDGRVSDFVSISGEKHYLELHPLRSDEPYYLGFFLMGAYQDIMGDMHNLFGRVTEAHVYLDEDEPDNFYIEKIISGASIREQLELVQYHGNELERRMNALIQREVRGGRLHASQGIRLLEQYRSAFGSYTYLDARSRYERNGDAAG